MTRKTVDRTKALDGALRRMFRAVEARSLPLAVTAVVDQLEAPPAPVRKAG